MLHIFCNKKGSGKTKALIKYANNKVETEKGNVVYIDDDNRCMFQLDRRIRFVSTKEYNLKNYSDFYGFLCGILSQDYDVSSVYVDGLFNIIDGNIEDVAHLFYDIENLTKMNNVDFYLNISVEKEKMPEDIKKYVA